MRGAREAKRTGRLRTRALLLLAALLLPMTRASATVGSDSVLDAIVELDVERARQLLSEHVDRGTRPVERAHLALYTGDCDAAEAALSGPAARASEEGAELLALATKCAKATAGALVIRDQATGIHVRLQDSRDEVLVPFIVEVAAKARTAMHVDLGVELPRPLRIDLVRDTFSLSAITGLPVTAAETTGTLAVARWGRVTMISPQATQLGYGWEDTLAHEITHLALARATRDRAPLWLQEGIAKRQESRWREARPGDGEPSADSVAYVAMQQGKAVGIDKLGPSIAMLPTPEAASIAYAEVQSFVNYWIVQNGEAALKLLFQDLKGLGAQSADAALTSVSGYTLAEWNLKWRDHLRQHPPAAPARHLEAAHDAQSLARWVRLSDLFYELGHYHAASEAMAPALVPAGKLAAVRWRAARAALADKRPEDAKNALGQVSDIDVLHGAWFAMHGRFLEQDQPAQAKVAHDLALSVDPLFDEVACQGRRYEEALPKASREREALCRTARQLRR